MIYFELRSNPMYTYRSEGAWIVRSRGIVAIILIVLILGLALNSLIIDPIRETDEVLVKTSMSPGNPALQLAPGDMNVIVVRPNIPERIRVTDILHLSGDEYTKPVSVQPFK
jgi:hypothetical protein